MFPGADLIAKQATLRWLAERHPCTGYVVYLF